MSTRKVMATRFDRQIIGERRTHFEGLLQKHISKRIFNSKDSGPHTCWRKIVVIVVVEEASSNLRDDDVNLAAKLESATKASVKIRRRPVILPRMHVSCDMRMPSRKPTRIYNDHPFNCATLYNQPVSIPQSCLLNR